ncbi:SagD family biosynthesis docking scaffold protein [Planobispora rosea]|uniref:SagD family biosynthesis docking scaffold protein n=1 Tax=Planobispora rosea TaxID=35762 RepID=A0A8J3S3A8_PLARO|nr:TOMM precursor leader peptide-binding protein [Planobispora rosea]GGS80314.1 SagD family biosynthesis docking scaffold protein [Planobispora rosea]GIH86024.1 SagD family biosynthesis docking scaffold protein [Planobispora rosea]
MIRVPDSGELTVALEKGPRLPVRTELGRITVGPLERPGVPGCRECVRVRERRVQPDARKAEAVRALHTPAASQWLTPLATDLVHTLVASEAAALAADAEPRTVNAVLEIDLMTLEITRHRFLPDPLCAHCGDLPPDAPAELTLRSRRKLGGSPRTREIELDALLETYVDGRTGMIRPLKTGVQGGLTVASAMLPIRAGNGLEPGVGRTRNYRASKLTAVLEALERYGGVSPGGRRTVIRSAYRDIAGDAVHPDGFGTHPEENYDRPDFEFRRFTEDTVCRWVWGYSFAQSRPVLVPENQVYYYARHMPDGEKPFVFEVSNGCALGSCLEEAILHGLLEVVERDAFLLTWHARRQVPVLDPALAADPVLPMQVAAITAETGHRVLCFDTTAEHGIPSVWVMAVDAERRPDQPATAHAAGSALTLEKATMNALSELGPLLADVIRRYPQQRERAQAMVRDPEEVVTMHDHSILYAAPEAADRLDFLIGRADGPKAGFGTDRFTGDDLTADLRAMIDAVLAAGMDVVVVDQTTPEHLAGGFRCVKVLVPGALPMTFGHRHRRLGNLPRLETVRTTDPHPFP